jgi:hypothetical protein
MNNYNRPVVYQHSKDMYIVKKTFFDMSAPDSDVDAPLVYFGSKKTAQIYIYHGVIKELISDQNLYIHSLGKDGQISLYRRPINPSSQYPIPYMELSLLEEKIYE